MKEHEESKIYAVCIYEYEDGAVGQEIRVDYYETLEEARTAAESANSDDVRICLVETTGEPGDEGRVIYDY